MKKITTFISMLVLFSASSFAQKNAPYSFNHELSETVPQVLMPVRDFTKDIADAIAFEEAGNYPIFAHHFDLSLTLENAGVWTTLENGDRIWRVNLKSNGAMSSCFFFENFYLPEGSTFHAYSADRKKYYAYDFENNQGNDLFSTDFMLTDEQVLEYYEPAAMKGKGRMRITAMSHQFRSIRMAGNCEVNIMCSPEGDNWQDEKKGIVRIYVVASQGAGWCTGTLINNTALDCKRYILTSWHCGQMSSAANFNQYKFRFNYEATSDCFASDTEGTTTNEFTGCTKKSWSNDNGGATGSDFLLLEMTSTTSPTWWATTAYFAGWTNSATASAGGGVSIHHPAGSNKKISTYTNTPTSVSWGGSVPSTHWEIKWVATVNNWGVTEGGSSGAPVYNSTGLVFGTLTGGNSTCSNKTAGDAYGKMSYHWTSNGTTPDRQLKPWLDPGNTGATTLAGGYTICSSTGVNTIKLDEAIKIYPNPNAGIFTLSFLGNADENKIRVMNVMGQEIKNFVIEQSSSNKYSIDLSTQANGLYFIEITGNGKTLSKKVSVLR